ncbi:MAG: iron-containing alcohol dehydrogenase [Pseudomonadota bacterium]
MKDFYYYQPTEIYFGQNQFERLAEITKKYGDSALLVTRDSDTMNNFAVAAKKMLEEAGIATALFNGVQPNPTTDSIDVGSQMAVDHNANVIIGLGGGSSMDAAKAIAVQATHEGSCWDYLFFKKEPTKKTLPIVAVTTTSGTGSHVTQVSVITNSAARDKSALYHPNIFPKSSIVDPVLMRTVPADITAQTGFDAFCHSFESLLHPNCSPYVEIMAKKAIQLVVQHLPTAITHGDNLEAREALALADTFAGLCIAAAGVTLPHGIAMAIGGMYPQVPHGRALAINYPAFVSFTYKHAVKEFAFLARALDAKLAQADDQEAAANCRQALEAFFATTGLNVRLSDYDVPHNELDKLAEQSMVLPDYKSNPRVATLAEMREILEEVY